MLLGMTQCLLSQVYGEEYSSGDDATLRRETAAEEIYVNGSMFLATTGHGNSHDNGSSSPQDGNSTDDSGIDSICSPSGR